MALYVIFTSALSGRGRERRETKAKLVLLKDIIQTSSIEGFGVCGIRKNQTADARASHVVANISGFFSRYSGSPNMKVEN